MKIVSIFQRSNKRYGFCRPVAENSEFRPKYPSQFSHETIVILPQVEAQANGLRIQSQTMELATENVGWTGSPPAGIYKNEPDLNFAYLTVLSPFPLT